MNEKLPLSLIYFTLTRWILYFYQQEWRRRRPPPSSYRSWRWFQQYFEVCYSCLIKKRRGPALNTELLTYWCCCFRSKIKASEVGVPFSIIDKTVATNPLVVRDGVVSAGIQMDEIDHVGEGLEQSLEKVHWKKIKMLFDIKDIS